MNIAMTFGRTAKGRTAKGRAPEACPRSLRVFFAPAAKTRKAGLQILGTGLPVPGGLHICSGAKIPRCGRDESKADCTPMAAGHKRSSSMKNVFKFMGIAAALTVIGFSVASCGGGDPSQTVATVTGIPLGPQTAVLTLEKNGVLAAEAKAGVSGSSVTFNLKKPDPTGEYNGPLFNGTGGYDVTLKLYDNAHTSFIGSGTGNVIIDYGCSLTLKEGVIKN